MKLKRLNKNIYYLIAFAFIIIIFGVYCVQEKNSFNFFDHGNANVKNSKTYFLKKGDILEQEFISKYNNLNKINISILNDKNVTVPYYNGYITVGLKDLEGNVITEYQYNRVLFEENYSISFQFPIQKDSKNKTYILYIKALRTLQFPIQIGENTANEEYLTINGEKTNNSLLTKSYYYKASNKLGFIILIGLFLVIGILIFVVIYFDFSISNKYLLFAIILSLMNIFLTPLYKGQDEIGHFSRIYEITDGNFISDKIDDWPGYEVPENINNVSFENYKNIKNNFISVDESNKILANMEYMAVYSPINYLPQFITLKVARMVSNYPIVWAYATRIIQAAFCIICVYFSIKIIPFGKNMIFLLGLLPSFLDASTLISTDGVLASLCLLFIAKILQIVYDKKTMIKKDYIILLLLSLGVSQCKLVYFPLLGILFLIPMHLKNIKKKNIFIILFLSLFCMFVWNSIAMHNLVNGQGVNTIYLINYYLKNPFAFIHIFCNTFISEFGNYISDLAGGRNLWYSSEIKDGSIVPQFFILFYFINVFRGDNLLEKKDKKVIFLCSFITFFLIYVSLLLACTPSYNDTIFGIQGRYFIPLLLPLYLVFTQNKKKINFFQFNICIPLIYLIYFIIYFIKFI